MITKFPDQWQDKLTQRQFDDLTDIQNKLFQPITDGDNILGISPTGTGKTLAYLFPTLLKLQPKRANNS